MLKSVSPAVALLVDPLALVPEPANMFPRAVKLASESFHLFRQHSIDEYPHAAP